VTSRFVVLGLAVPRSTWFRSLSQWANAGSLPLEFVKCISAEELRARLHGGRPWSAVLIDGALPALDRDLVDDARQAGCAVIVVDDARVHRDWEALAPDAVMNGLFDRRDLVETLTRYATPLTAADDLAVDAGAEAPAGWRARVVMVCGPGGTGVSTAAMALAQGLGDDVRHGGMVLLADMARHAEQAMLHDARDVVPGIQEVVDAHRLRRPAMEEVRALAFDVPDRRYQLLLGLRRARAWGTLRPRAFDAAIDSLRRGWRVVVCDCDADLEGEAQGGSTEVEDRNRMARTAAALADVTFAVGVPGVKGLHSLARVVGDLVNHGVPAARIVPVFNRAGRAGRGRAALASALADLLRGGAGAAALGLPSPMFLPERGVDQVTRDGARLPAALTAPLAAAFEGVLDRCGPRPPAVEEPQLVVPGSLGAWHDLDGGENV
jgi:hypothetical protein